ncbi:MAG: hypothetical protein ACR5KX_02230 [Wolbachia sp.]
MKIENYRGIKLKWDEENKKIILDQGNLHLKVKDSKGEKVLTIEQEAIISNSKDYILNMLKIEEIDVILHNIYFFIF